MVLGAPAETLLAKSIPPEVWNSSQICAPYDIETRARQILGSGGGMSGAAAQTGALISGADNAGDFITTFVLFRRC